MRILMLGNSFTFANDMPEMLAGILEAEVVHHTRGGAHLAEQLNPDTEMGAKTLDALAKEAWDYVILQEYSTGPITRRERFLHSVEQLCDLIRRSGATPILYATWAFKQSGIKLAESGLDYDEMYRGLYNAYHEAGEKNGMPVADVGKRFYELSPQENLYSHDDYHPNRAGSQLAAETIAAVITGLEQEMHVIRQSVNPNQIPDEADNRLRILYLYRMLLEYTDDEHSLTNPQIRRMMQEQHGIKIHRTTVPRDIEVLRAAGIEVLSTRTRSLNYYLADRPFSIPELRLLIDAVQSSKFITEQKSQALIEKLYSQTSTANALKLRRAVHVTGKAKSDNEKGYYIVDAINDAINSGRKISFYYYDYDGKKHHVLKNNGAPYTVSPYDLIWDGDYYYLTGYCDERSEVRVFRVDRIEKQPEILETPAVKAPRSYRVEKYTQEVFRMFSTDETVEVRLLCDNDVMKFVVDQFGLRVRVKTVDKDHFVINVKVCPGPTFYRWVFGFSGGIVIEAPEEIRERYKEMLQLEMEHYNLYL